MSNTKMTQTEVYRRLWEYKIIKDHVRSFNETTSLDYRRPIVIITCNGMIRTYGSHAYLIAGLEDIELKIIPIQIEEGIRYLIMYETYEEMSEYLKQLITKHEFSFLNIVIDDSNIKEMEENNYGTSQA